ncbi:MULTISPECIES: thiamine phosphate synthase [Bacillus]|uniref:thiamine phosphate synthase n=1 Tax=Bacillus TaxID=1386 RepID=UPI00030D6280|nr:MULTISPECIES: thiamine phosphate synthase [Bacillus]
MKVDKSSLLLYAVTDRHWVKESSLVQQVEAALKGGITFLQLREKNLSNEAFLEEALQIKQLTDKYDIPFVINDNVDVALACDADGVHIGQDDLPVNIVREKIGPNKILGVSAHTVEEAKRAEDNGADYLGVGAVFNTATKLDANTVSFQTLKDICERATIPIVAIGGINEENMTKLGGTGIDGVAVVSAIFGADEIDKASQHLLALSKRMVNE